MVVQFSPAANSLIAQIWLKITFTSKYVNGADLFVTLRLYLVKLVRENGDYIQRRSDHAESINH
jgi:hypothetical protein